MGLRQPMCLHQKGGFCGENVEKGGKRQCRHFWEASYRSSGLQGRIWMVGRAGKSEGHHEVKKKLGKYGHILKTPVYAKEFSSLFIHQQ